MHLMDSNSQDQVFVPRTREQDSASRTRNQALKIWQKNNKILLTTPETKDSGPRARYQGFGTDVSNKCWNTYGHCYGRILNNMGMMSEASLYELYVSEIMLYLCMKYDKQAICYSCTWLHLHLHHVSKCQKVWMRRLCETACNAQALQHC